MKIYEYSEKKDTRSGFGDGLTELGKSNPNVVALCADLTGSFYDTNIASELTALGIPASGTAMDGTSTVNLISPNAAQVDIDELSPLVPPVSGVDDEGYLTAWNLNLEYHFDGTLSAGGPSYTGGTFEVVFDDFFDDTNDRTVISGVLTGSTL